MPTARVPRGCVAGARKGEEDSLVGRPGSRTRRRHPRAVHRPLFPCPLLQEARLQARPSQGIPALQARVPLRVPCGGPARTPARELGRIISIISRHWVSFGTLPRRWGRGVLAVVALIPSAARARPGPLRGICLVLWKHLGLRFGRAGGGQFVNSCLF